MNRPQIGFGPVRHTRLRPVRRAFSYPTCFLLLPLRSMHAGACGRHSVAHNRRALLGFHDRDHGDGRANAVDWLDELLAAEGITDARGEAWLHCYPRLFGYTFKPVSFWYCHHEDGHLRAIVVEVNNTFGERHCYVLDAPAWGREQKARKAFYVSPFCRVEGDYRFRFLWNRERNRTVVTIDHDDEQGPLLHTSVSGQLREATPAALRLAVWRFPFLTLGIAARIRWQALRLWLAGTPLIAHPAATANAHRPLGTSR